MKFAEQPVARSNRLETETWNHLIIDGVDFMGRLSIDLLKPGMVVGEDLVGTNGRFLLGKGVSLTDKHLRVLKMWGVMDAEIDGVSASDVESDNMATFDAALFKEAIRQTRQRFRNCDMNHPALRELFRLCSLRKARNMTQEQPRERIVRLTCVSNNGEEKKRTRLPQVNPQSLLHEGIKLPSLPAIFMQIQDVINNPRSSAHSIANVIGKDTGLTARLLQLVNSTFYGFPSKIDSLSRAVTIVGTKQLSTLALGVTLVSVFKNIPQALIDLKSFWKHSLGCAILSRSLAKIKNIANTERLFLGGLVHDIGRMIVYGYLAEHAREALERARNDSMHLMSAEVEVMGFTHQSIGSLLLKKWRLPLTLESIVRYHHEPMKSKQPMDSAIVHMADLITNALEVGSSGERLVPEIDTQAWETLGVPISILGPTITELDDQISEVGRLFFLEGQA